MRRSIGTVAIGICVTLWMGVAATALAQEREKPLDVGLEEQFDIDYVLIDFLVLDAENRTVPDVALENLKLKAGGQKIPVNSLDVHCPIGAAGDPRTHAEVRAPETDPGAEPSRIVLVFDYDHMAETAEVFDRALEMIDRWPTGEEEHMIASLGEVVRIETPFTTDLNELRWAIRRMRNDRDLYAGNRFRTNEMRFFDRIRALFDILSRWPGRKSVVLFSGPLMDDGFRHDPFFRDLSALSAAARTAIYPVDTAGLRTSHDPLETGLFGPPELRRLANETGGRITSETNNIGLAYAQAQRDMGCFYTLGFYDPRFKPDRKRELTIKITGRNGLRVVYPDHYVVRSEKEKQESLVRTASLAPHMFESDDVSTDLVVLGARADGNWRTVLGVEMRLAPGKSAGDTWKVRGFLRKPNGTIVHTFNRAIRLDEETGHGDEIVATLFQEMDIVPGDYAASVVLVDPEGAPRAATRAVTLPEVPGSGPFILGPILGHSGKTTFEPLMRPAVIRGDTLESLTVLCMAGAGAKGLHSTVDRRVVDLEGVETLRLEEASVQLSGAGMQCHEIVDVLATEDLLPGGYEIGASAVVSDFTIDGRTTEFTVREAGDDSMKSDPR